MARPRKREEELARPRERNGKDKATTQDVTLGELRKVTIPHADGSWHPIAKRLYDSLRTSGQADYFQNSDWNYAWFICNEISLYQQAQGRARSAVLFATLLQGLEKLLITEADRRKARLELRAPEPDQTPLSVVAIDDYRKALELD